MADKTCPMCSGNGGHEVWVKGKGTKWVVCVVCNGTGKVSDGR